MKSTHYVIGLLAGPLAFAQAQGGENCKRINSCVSNHQHDYATSYCGSYLSIGTSTSTVYVSTAAVTSTTTTYTSTSSVIDDSVYESCGANTNDKHKRAAATPKTHSKPFCLRHLTRPAGISSACECLHIASATTTTSATTTSTTTSTVSAVYTTSVTSFYMVIPSIDFASFDYGSGSDPQTGGGVQFGGPQDGVPPEQFYLNNYQGQTCALFDQTNLVAGQGPTTDNLVHTFIQGDEPSSVQIVTCVIEDASNTLQCSAGNDYINAYTGTTPSPSSSFSWQLIDTTTASYPNYNQYTIQAQAANPFS